MQADLANGTDAPASPPLFPHGSQFSTFSSVSGYRNSFATRPPRPLSNQCPRLVLPGPPKEFVSDCCFAATKSEWVAGRLEEQAQELEDEAAAKDEGKDDDPTLADGALLRLLLLHGRLRLAALGRLGLGEALVGEALLRGLGHCVRRGGGSWGVVLLVERVRRKRGGGLKGAARFRSKL